MSKTCSDRQQGPTGTAPTMIVTREVSSNPLAPLKPDKTYSPGVKVDGTSHTQLPVFGIWSGSSQFPAPKSNREYIPPIVIVLLGPGISPFPKTS